MFDSVNSDAATAFAGVDPLAGMALPGGAKANNGSSNGTAMVFDLDDPSVGKSMEAIPPGIYNAKIENTEFGDSSNGNPMITISFRLTDGEYEKRLVFNHYTLNNDFGKANLKLFLQRVTPEYPLSAFNPEEYCNNCVAAGRACRVKLGIKMYQGTRRNQVKEVLEAGTMDKFFGNNS